MSWQVGDLALCVSRSYWGITPELWEPQIGCIYTVADVDTAFDDDLVLDLQEDPHRQEDRAWDANDFRKIVHDKQEQCEPEFVTLLKRVKRTVPAETASDWLIRAGPIAKQMNEDARKENERGN